VIAAAESAFEPQEMGLLDSGEGNGLAVFSDLFLEHPAFLKLGSSSIIRSTRQNIPYSDEAGTGYIYHALYQNYYGNFFGPAGFGFCALCSETSPQAMQKLVITFEPVETSNFRSEPLL